MDAPGWQLAMYRIGLVSALALIVGVAVSLCAIGFVEALHWLNDRLLVSPYARILMRDQPVLVAVATVLVPALGGLVVGLLVHLGIKEQRALAPPDVIMAVHSRRPLPSTRSGLVSSLAALVSLGSGASVGQYGPLVYLGALVGSIAGRLHVRMRHFRAIAIACGVAAAIATAFNAPIAGLVFAHEVVLRHYSLRAFAPVTVAAATGYVIANVVFARPPLFRVEFGGVAHSYEFLLFALEGVLCAALACLFVALVRGSGRLAQRLSAVGWARPALAGLLLGVVALWLPEVLGIGQETLRFATIEGAFTPGELVVLVIAKVLLTALCVGFGFVGGIFSPALLIGILFGALCGLLMPELVPVPLSGIVVYAICGMMAMASAVIGAPLTTILIVFELTRNYDLTIAAMVAVVFSNLVAYRVMGRSLFDWQLRERGFDLSQGRDKAILDQHRVSRYGCDAYTRATPADTTAGLSERLRRDEHDQAHMVDHQGRYLGRVRLQDLLNASAGEEPAALVRPAPVTFSPRTTVWQAMEILRDYPGDTVPLLDGEGKLRGVVPEAAVIRAYLEIIHDLREEENEAA